MNSATTTRPDRDQPAADALASVHDARRPGLHRRLCADGAVGLSLYGAGGADGGAVAGSGAGRALRPASSEAHR